MVIENFQTLYLKTIDNTQASVTLEAYQFVTESRRMRYIIPAGNINTGRNNTDYYIFATDPGTQNNNGNIGYFTTNNQGKNNAQFEITSDNVNKLTDGYVYIRYSTTTSGMFGQSTTTYYVAKVLLTDLVKDGGCDISGKF